MSDTPTNDAPINDGAMSNAPRVQNIVIPSSHYEESVRFYRDGLQLPVFFQTDECCYLRAGGVFLAIHPGEPGSDFAPRGGSIYLDVAVPDLDRARERLLQHRVAIRREWEDGNGRFLLLADPDGNWIELLQASGPDLLP